MLGHDGVTEYRGFYCLLPTDNRFAEMDDEITWYSGRVLNSTQVLFRLPAWPFCLWPKGDHSRDLYAQVVSRLSKPIEKSMNAAHAVFDKDDMDTAVMEARKWKNVILDFSKVKDIGELSSKVIYGDAGEEETLDYDWIQVPHFWTIDQSTGQKCATHNEELLGFKVASVTSEGARKVKRTDKKKSKLAEKRAAAAVAARGNP